MATAFVDICEHGERTGACPSCRAEDPGLNDTLHDIETFVRRFVALNAAQVVAITLWVVMTYVVVAFEVVGYLSIRSAEKRSGKTRLLDVLAVLVYRPMLAADMTPAVLFRVVDEMRPTVLFDEVDVIFGGKGERADELRGLLNAGYKRGGAAWRMEMGGKTGVARSFDVFGPKALAGIGTLPDTIADRSFPLEMTRQLRVNAVERFRTRGKLEETAPIREALKAWGETAVEALAVARPPLPDELNDRAQDIWEPLLAIADRAGGDWPARARAAARELHESTDVEDSSTGVLLLAHVREVFDERPDRVAVSTEELLSGLVDNPEGPWARWWSVDTDGQKRSSASGLARKLRPYGIRPKRVKIEGTALHGYRREQFVDAWDRYAPPGDGTDGTQGTPQVVATSTVPFVPSVPSTNGAPACVRCDRYGVDHHGAHIEGWLS